MYFYIYFGFVQVMLITRYVKIEGLNVRCTIIIVLLFFGFYIAIF
jgi:hypothetical protein